VPAHSFKFGAELQEKQSCKNPILVRIETNAGHGAGRSTDQVIGENADLLSFALFEMGFKNLKK
jgi:prolyl oligopeptidase